VYCTVRRRLRARAARLGAMRMAVVSDIVVVCEEGWWETRGRVEGRAGLSGAIKSEI